MAVGIENFPNIDTTDPTNYPHGAIKDDPAGVSGTPLYSGTLNDMYQFFDQLLTKASMTANGLPDNVTNGFQYYDALQRLINTGGNTGWSTGTNALTVVSVTGGTVNLTASTIVYNRWKTIGRTVFIQLQLRGIITTGSVSAFEFANITNLSGQEFDNIGMKIAGIYNASGLSVELAPTFGLILRPMGGGNFPLGLNDLDINIVAEF